MRIVDLGHPSHSVWTIRYCISFRKGENSNHRTDSDMINIRYYYTDSRWIWLYKGLPSLRRARALFQVRRHTMTTAERSRTLWDLCQKVLEQNVPGVFVECGVWRGGSAAIMGLAAQNRSPIRPLHLFDSFEGLPEPGPEDGAKAVEYSGGRSSGKLVSISKCQAGLELVRTFLFQQIGLNPKDVVFHAGWFSDTIPAAARQVGPIAILRLDGDWYASTQVCLEHLYPMLSPGGVVIMDDYYCWEGCKKATDEYRQKHGITAPFRKADEECCYWIKP
jgi:O-methyltransferase